MGLSYFVSIIGLTSLAFLHNITAQEKSPVTTCPELIPTEGVNLTCTNGRGDPADCLERAEVGATASYRCLQFYENERSGFIKKCKSNGEWFPSKTYECRSDCGLQNPDYEGYIANGYLANTTHWPWHATIFRKSIYKKGPHDYHYTCGGALISPSLILTAAHCVVNTHGQVTPSENLRVVLFAGFSDYKMIMKDSNSRVLKIASFEYHKKYNPWNYDNDIAIFRLSENVEFSKFIRPVCFPRNNDKSIRLHDYHVSPGSSGYVVGFGKDETGRVSKRLKETQLPIVSTRDCADIIGKVHNGGQYCAGYLNGTAACSGDSGGGMYFSYKTAGEERFIVQGLVSHARRGKCDSFTIFANVANYAQWIEDMEYKFHAADVENDRRRDQDLKKKRNCNALRVSANVVLKCFENPALGSGMAKLIPCETARPKDIGKFSCLPNFMEKISRLAGSQKSTVRVAHSISLLGNSGRGVALCQDDGAWSQRSIECEPECGKSGDTLPWQAKIYLFLSRKDVAAQGYLCGGSLIEASFILTSASCILSAKGGKIPYSLLRVVLGSSHANQTVDFKDPNLQILTVRNVWIAPTFNFNTLSGNLALIQMTSDADLTQNVRRVCYLRPGILGSSKAALPNYLSNLRTKFAETIIKPNVSSYTNCNSMKRTKIGNTQQCSVVSPLTDVCRNDSGNGLLTISGGISVLQAVLSHGYVKPESKKFCSLNSHVVYERIDPYGMWIKGKISEGSKAINLTSTKTVTIKYPSTQVLKTKAVDLPKVNNSTSPVETLTTVSPGNETTIISTDQTLEITTTNATPIHLTKSQGSTIKIIQPTMDQITTAEFIKHSTVTPKEANSPSTRILINPTIVPVVTTTKTMAPTDIITSNRPTTTSAPIVVTTTTSPPVRISITSAPIFTTAASAPIVSKATIAHEVTATGAPIVATATTASMPIVTSTTGVRIVKSSGATPKTLTIYTTPAPILYKTVDTPIRNIKTIATIVRQSQTPEVLTNKYKLEIGKNTATALSDLNSGIVAIKHNSTTTSTVNYTVSSPTQSWETQKLIQISLTKAPITKSSAQSGISPKSAFEFQPTKEIFPTRSTNYETKINHHNTELENSPTSAPLVSNPTNALIVNNTMHFPVHVTPAHAPILHSKSNGPAHVASYPVNESITNSEANVPSEKYTYVSEMSNEPGQKARTIPQNNPAQNNLTVYPIHTNPNPTIIPIENNIARYPHESSPFIPSVGNIPRHLPIVSNMTDNATDQNNPANVNVVIHSSTSKNPAVLSSTTAPIKNHTAQALIVNNAPFDQSNSTKDEIVNKPTSSPIADSSFNEFPSHISVNTTQYANLLSNYYNFNPNNSINVLKIMDTINISSKITTALHVSQSGGTTKASIIVSDSANISNEYH